MMSRPYPASETPRDLKKRKLNLKLKKLKPHYQLYLKNGIAYTEDHIPVQKLHLFGMPMELTQDALLDYFTRNYGHVLGIERIEASVPTDEDQEYLPTWNAFALFAEARDAAKVLQSPEHMVSNYKFRVQACFSWLQPVADEESNDLGFPTFPSILQLNDDCLESVLQYLKLADQIRLARTCTRFRNIYQRVSARQHKSVRVYMTKGLTLWETRDFFQLSGYNFESLTCEFGSANFKRCFYDGVHFPNLKYLHVNDDELKIHKIQRILLETLKLTKLALYTLPRTDRLELAHLKELKTLEITEWNTESLNLPTSIESLTIRRWMKISCLPSILKGQTRIKKLEVKESSVNIFEEMAGSQAFASLEVLKISNCDFYIRGLFAQLPKLKKLCIENTDVDKDFFSEIIKDTPHQLDHLDMSEHDFYLDKEELLRITSLIRLQTLVLHYPKEIDDEVITAFGKLTELKRFGLSGSNITDSLVLKLLINCPKLSKLTAEKCRNISDNLVDSITRLLRKDIQSGKNQRDLPFRLYLNNYEFYLRNIPQTDPDIVEVLLNELEMSEWFDEEFKL